MSLGLRRIGVLGGMGPSATVLLQQRLIDAVSAEDDASHVPLLIDMNPQVPSRLDWILKGEGADPGRVLATMACRLESAGAEALVMPCNTAHHFAAQINCAVGIPFINMVELSAAETAQQFGAGTTVGVLASPATQQIGLFSRAFAAHGLQVMYPTQMTELLSTIRRIKSTGVSKLDGDSLTKAAEDCRQNGAQCLLVGCSEFSLLTHGLQCELPIVDTLQVLTEAVVRFAHGGDTASPGS